MSIDEVTDTLSKNVGGKKGLMIVGCGLVGVLFLLSLKNSSSGETVNVTSYSSYPDVGKNADVVISSLQNSIDYQTEQLNEKLDTNTGMMLEAGNEIYQNLHYDIVDFGDVMNSQFQTTHDLVSDGFANQQFLIGNMHSDMMDGIDLINSNMNNYSQDIINSVQHESDSLRGTLITGFDGVMGSMDEQYSSLNDSINTVSSQVNKVYEDVRIYEVVETPSVSVGSTNNTSRPLSNPEINALSDFLKGDSGGSEKNYSTNPVSKVGITPTTTTNLVGIGKKVG